MPFDLDIDGTDDMSFEEYEDFVNDSFGNSDYDDSSDDD